MSQQLYMKLDGIDGELPLGSDEKAIGIMSFAHGLSMPVSPSRPSLGAGANLRRTYCEHGLFHVTKAFDSTSPKIFAACSNGVLFESIVIFLCAGGDSTSPGSDGRKTEPFLQIILENSIIADYQYSHSGHWPVESIAFRYTSIGWKTSWKDPETGGDANLEPIGWEGTENVPKTISVPSKLKWGQGGLF